MNIVGQKHLLGPKGPLKKMLDVQKVRSFILYGPSGVGKTTIARYISENINKDVYKFNATSLTKSELEHILKNYENQDIVLVVDEVHRLDKQKQNLFLPYLEKDNIILIGTTTENPVFSLHNAFLSRVLVFETKYISEKEMLEYLQNLNLEKYSNNVLEDIVLNKIVLAASGDIRKARQYFIFLCETYKSKEITDEVLDSILHINMKYEKDGDRHYDLISAFQKSIRASDVNAALFYLAHLLLSGDYQIILRRLSIIAYEDIGLANFNLVNKVFNAVELFKQLGMPEGRIILANIVIELALSPKSTTAYNALDLAIEDAKKYPNISIPGNIRQNRSKDNEYIKQECFMNSNLPEEFKNKQYLKFKGSSKYEEALKERYEKLIKEKNGKEIFENKVSYLEVDIFEKARIYFTTKEQGNSKGDFSSNNMAYQVGDDKKIVLKNREDLAKRIGINLDNFIFANQVHGVGIKKVTKEHKGKGKYDFLDGIEKTDVLYSYEKDVSLACFYADCTPIYFVEETVGLIGIIHAGWQGTVKDVVKITLNKLEKEEKIDVSKLKVVIGPSIKKESFEVEEDVYKLFCEKKYAIGQIDKISEKKWIIDIVGYNVCALIDSGVQKENIYISNIDTYKAGNLFSFRRDNITGRMIGVISNENIK